MALCGVLFSLALVLGFFESMLSTALLLPPGVRLGLSNVVVLFALLALGKKSALALLLLKSLFAFLTRGAVAGILSLAGGGLSVLGMVLLLLLPISLRLLSMLGGILHSVGQLVAASWILGSGAVFYYLPLLLLTGAAAGLLTGTVYQTLDRRLIELMGRR